MNSTGADYKEPLYLAVPLTVVYSIIFVMGLVGNVSTCFVIARNRHMHTATNYYLFSLAISDLLLLVSGLPAEMYHLWARSYVFGEIYCLLTCYLAETCANATVLTITAFTVERYVAICHPFLSHQVSKLSRAVKFILVIWLLGLCLAIPQSVQFGVKEVSEGELACTILDTGTPLTMVLTFALSSLLFFLLPMTLITALYLLIAIKLRRSRVIKRPSEQKALGSQNRVIRMLVAVVVAFFICWAPFHGQRLVAVYGEYSVQSQNGTAFNVLYRALTHLSGPLYYLGTTVNPLLYNIMSHKFREAFKGTLGRVCGRSKERGKLPMNYSVLSRHNTGQRSNSQRRSLQTTVNQTISNSSLQDLGGEKEFMDSELVRAMASSR